VQIKFSIAINFFDGNPAPMDSLYGFIVPNQDTVHFCQPNTIISYNTQTNILFGPDYNFTWNNGATTQDLTITQSGTYIITVPWVVVLFIFFDSKAF
jgi:hypothetical protein